jgi:putative solute:sodium symporter small subunit
MDSNTALKDRAPAPSERLLDAYWRRNKWIMLVLLALWAAVSLGCGVLWADTLNQWRLPGTAYPLGFWFAQQGSIVGFVCIIFVYAVLMNRLDRAYHAKIEAQMRREAGK